MNDSMINPSIIDLLEKVDNRYSLVVATSRRARKIIEGEEPTLYNVGNKALTIAINEVNQGIIKIDETEDESNNIDETEITDVQEAEEGLD